MVKLNNIVKIYAIQNIGYMLIKRFFQNFKTSSLFSYTYIKAAPDIIKKSDTPHPPI